MSFRHFVLKGFQPLVLTSNLTRGSIGGSFHHVVTSLPCAPAPAAFTCVRNYAKGKGPVKESKKVGKGGKPKVTLTEDEMDQVIEFGSFHNSVRFVVDTLKENYIKNLSIRAGVGIEDLEVTFENEKFPLQELASISRKGNNLLVLNMTALPTALKPVLEAITTSGMNVNPQQDGTVIYLQLPKITREHREVLAKNAKTLFTKAKDDLTKVQNNYVKKANGSKGTLSEDLIFNVTENVRFLTNLAIAECDQLLTTKQKELLGSD